MRIGCVPYLNAKPLAQFLDHPVEYYVPSQLELLLEQGLLDIALTSSISFLKRPDYHPLYEGGIISSQGAVASVCVFHKKSISHLSDIKTIAYTSESKTSIALFKILWVNALKQKPENLVETQNDPDALLLIGDRALHFKDPNYIKNDLGFMWHQLTNLPFVYALWVSRHPVDEKLRRLFEKSKALGLAKRGELVKNEPDSAGALEYLTKNIQYEMNQECLKGLKAFQEYCFKLGLIDTVRELPEIIK